MSNSKNSVGANPTPCQPTTTFKTGLFAPVGGGDLTFTAADILAIATAVGSAFPDASVVAPTDAIHQIDIDLKPIAGEVKYWDGVAYVDGVATTSDAVYYENGGQSNVDPSGSRCDYMKDEAGCPIPNFFEQIDVVEGSAVEVALTIVKG